MNFPDIYLKAIYSIYTNPQLCVRINELKSTWRTQERRIRQGCPLSPYLFIILLTVMFRDIQDDLNLTRGKMEGLDFTELMYADDAALITNDANSTNRLIGKIETHAEY